MQGRSFRQNLRGQTPSDWRNEMYYRSWLHHPIRTAHLGIRNQRYKLIFYYGKGWTNPELQQKPPSSPGNPLTYRKIQGKCTTLNQDPTYQKIIGEMKTELLRLRKSLGNEDQNHQIMNEKSKKTIRARSLGSYS